MASHGKVENPHTARMAEFISGLTYEALPRDVRERIKLLILDSLGCGIYGAAQPWCRIIQETLGRIDTTGSNSVWATRLRVSSPHAALANGTAIQGFELDDVHRQGVLH